MTDRTRNHRVTEFFKRMAETEQSKTDQTERRLPMQDKTMFSFKSKKASSRPRNYRVDQFFKPMAETEKSETEQTERRLAMQDKMMFSFQSKKAPFIAPRITECMRPMHETEQPNNVQTERSLQMQDKMLFGFQSKKVRFRLIRYKDGEQPMPETELPKTVETNRRLPMQDIFSQPSQDNSATTSSQTPRKSNTDEAETEVVTFKHIPDFYNGKRKSLEESEEKTKKVQTDVLYTSLLDLSEDDLLVDGRMVNHDEIDRRLREVFDKEQKKMREEKEKEARLAPKKLDEFFAYQKELLKTKPEYNPIQAMMFKLADSTIFRSRRDCWIQVSEVLPYSNVPRDTVYETFEKLDFTFKRLKNKYKLEEKMLDNLKKVEWKSNEDEDDEFEENFMHTTIEKDPIQATMFKLASINTFRSRRDCWIQVSEVLPYLNVPRDTVYETFENLDTTFQRLMKEYQLNEKMLASLKKVEWMTSDDEDDDTDDADSDEVFED